MTSAEWTPPPGSVATLPIPTLEGVASAHLIGVGGAGMRNLARLLLARGIRVTGSDLKGSASLDELTRNGATVWVGHDAALLGAPDIVIISSAIAPGNPELVEAERRRIAVWRRQQALGALAAGRRVVSVSGTHGKTTTTSMIAAVLEAGGTDPTYLIGGDLNESGSGARHGDGDLFVFEADESDGSHLVVAPWLGVITSIDADHLDFYPGGLDEIVRAFSVYAGTASIVVAAGDDPNVREALERSPTAVTWYGSGAGVDVHLEVLHLGPEGARGRLTMPDGAALDLALLVDGPHNLANAAAAVTVGMHAGIAPATSAEAVGRFTGVHRRFERRGAVGGAEFFDDYGHNPTEMRVTIETARRRSPGRLVALVQPHRHARVQALWRELGASVAGADLVVVTDVYAAAQQPIPGVTGRLVADGVSAADPDVPVVYLPHRGDVVEFLAAEVQPGDLVVSMGCGDVWMIVDAIVERLGGSR